MVSEILKNVNYADSWGLHDLKSSLWLEVICQKRIPQVQVKNWSTNKKAETLLSSLV